MHGVNKLVMEVRSDGKYFDKALLFLRPEHANTEQHEISDGAERLLKKIIDEKTKTSKKRINPVLTGFIGAAAGTLLTLASLFLCGFLAF